ncbi:MAG TPA: hypothetical protein VJC14_00065 [Candidatus Paceibacterota bacterium]
MLSYKHTQIGYLILFILLALIVFYVWLYGVISIEIGSNFFVVAIMSLVLFILASFLTLKVTIDANYVRIKFGYGIFHKKFLIKEIVSAKTVKNHWYYGWGIRVWFWPYMWIYNISGFDAVEITMKSGKIYRIGTDVPSELETAIKRTTISSKDVT